MDRFTKSVRSYIMSKVHSKNTKPELAIFAALKMRGIKFRKHYKKLPGRPDIVFPDEKIAVFIDGDFWHGYRFPMWSHTVPVGYWRKKIKTNRERDRRNVLALKKMGWRVLRVWEHEINKDIVGATSKIIIHL